MQMSTNSDIEDESTKPILALIERELQTIQDSDDFVNKRQKLEQHMQLIRNANVPQIILYSCDMAWKLQMELLFEKHGADLLLHSKSLSSLQQLDKRIRKDVPLGTRRKEVNNSVLVGISNQQVAPPLLLPNIEKRKTENGKRKRVTSAWNHLMREVINKVEHSAEVTAFGMS